MPNESKRWLADYLIESELTLVAGEEKLEYVHPGGRFEVHLRAAEPETGTDEQLSEQTIVDAPDLDQAEELAEKELRKFLRLLSFITNHPYRLSRKIRLIDWTPGLSTREQYVYAEEPPQDPEKALSSGLLDTAIPPDFCIHREPPNRWTGRCDGIRQRLRHK